MAMLVPIYTCLIFILQISLGVNAIAGEGDLQKSARYMKLPFEKISNAGYVQDLEKRDNGVIDATLVDQILLYAVKLQIGTPPQDVYVQLDTGSSDLYVISPNNRDCEPKSGTDSPVLSDNFELTATASQDIQTATANFDYITPCSYYGTFDNENSSTFQTNDTLFGINYGDGTYANGIYGTDRVTIANTTLLNITFGVANDTTNVYGTFGVSIIAAESSGDKDGNRTGFFYNNVPVLMKEQGAIERVVYSLYLNNRYEQFGSVLFGAVNHNRYSGTLYTIPMLESMMQENCTAPGMFITAHSLTLESNNSDNRTVYAERFPVLFDSGTSYAVLPPEITDPIAREFGARYDSDQGAYEFDCDRMNDTRLSVDLGGFNISCNLSNFVTTNGDSCLLWLKRSSTIAVLGDAFLIDAYAVYDLENHEIAIAQANFDSSEDDIEVVTDTIPGATPAPGYSDTWVYTPGDSIGSGYFTSDGDSSSSTSGSTASSTSDSSSASSSRNIGQGLEPFSLSFLISSVLYSILI